MPSTITSGISLDTNLGAVHAATAGIATMWHPWQYSIADEACFIGSDASLEVPIDNCELAGSTRASKS